MYQMIGELSIEHAMSSYCKALQTVLGYQNNWGTIGVAVCNGRTLGAQSSTFYGGIPAVYSAGSGAC
jgi:hypothetical protein